MQASAIAHPNVALIKYWGKQDTELNLPATGSLSLTLGGLQTRTLVTFSADLIADSVTINGAADERAAPRVTRCLDILRDRAGVALKAAVESSNDFPTGAGLASSASGYAALVTAAAGALDLDVPLTELENIARIGSGSAPRSLYDGIVLLRQSAHNVACESVLASTDWPLDVVVAVTSNEHKAIGSTEGMELSRRTSPFYTGWIDTHEDDLAQGLAAVKARDFERLAELSEHSCLKMHAVAMSSQPPLFYWNAATVAALRRVQEMRTSGVPVFFTIDAGPQVKAVCESAVADQVAAELANCDGVIDVLQSGLGAGARIV